MKVFTMDSTYDILEDIQRVENTTYALKVAIHTYMGIILELDIKTNWNRNDLPTIEHMDRIRNNVEAIRKVIESEYIIPPFNDRFNYKNANELEESLDFVYQYLKELMKIISQPLANLYFANEPILLPSNR